ncbi:DUF58 domain-containing protein [Asticcacaulis benevestitus]|uniref:DUF58 domain-containing protein n=1 Tax=Asticcacaulis benevestitus DSM 16100 = ATCC BAA-896 TaxID=1121022 RepID=V4P683_9CAUL|nr:DUF58 domain-containing protein [Asticcacaulis benevestitus]ESQ89472.1 hypothetical protein ABENE_13920 [Asticcacaulis benevestitus DSM 16100 = ATCC BAA-896]
MNIYPTPRLLVLLALSVPVALGVGIFAPGVWAWVPLVAGLCFVAALLDGLFAPVGEGLTFQMSAPETLGVGRTVEVPFTARFTRWRQPGLIELRLGLGRVLAASEYPRRLVRQDGAFGGTLSLKATARGRGEIEAGFVRWQGFAGLVYVQKKLTLDHEIVVTPDIHGVEQDAADLFSLDNIYGVRVQNQLYNGSEYHALREYDASQDHRRIDWRSSARHMKLFSREYQAERNHHIVLAYDTGRLMGEPLAGLKRLDRAIYAGLLLGYTALKIGDNVRTFAFASKPYHVAPAVTGIHGFNALKYQLSALEDTPEESNHTLALADLNAKVARRSLIILFSDFIDEISADLMVESLNRLSKKHLVLFVAFKDEVVEDLMTRPPVEPEDVTKAVFAKRLSDQRERVFAQLRRQGVEVLETPTELLATSIVSKYLALKRADRL